MLRTSIALSVLLVGLPAAAEIRVGQPAPAFELPNMPGKMVSSRSLKGKPTILVIGTAKEAAPACREWMVTLDRNFETHDVGTYQVVVLNNPWFIPHFAVINELKKFVPDHGHDQVLLEWKRGFGDLYNVPFDNDPRVVVIDKAGVVRHWYRGGMNDQALLAVLDAAEKLEG